SVLGGSLALLTYRYGMEYSVVLHMLLVVGLILLGIHLARVDIGRDRRPGASGMAPTNTPVMRFAHSFPYRRQVSTVLVDLVLSVAAYYGAYLLRFEEAFALHRPMLVATVIPVVVCKVFALALFGAYRGLWRYTGLADMVRLARGITAGSVAAVVYLV